MLFDPKRDNVYYSSDKVIIVDSPDLGHPVLILKKNIVSKIEVKRALDHCGMLLGQEITYNGEKCFAVRKA